MKWKWNDSFISCRRTTTTTTETAIFQVRLHFLLQFLHSVALAEKNQKMLHFIHRYISTYPRYQFTCTLSPRYATIHFTSSAAVPMHQRFSAKPRNSLFPMPTEIEFHFRTFSQHKECSKIALKDKMQGVKVSQQIFPSSRRPLPFLIKVEPIIFFHRILELLLLLWYLHENRIIIMIQQFDISRREKTNQNKSTISEESSFCGPSAADVSTQVRGFAMIIMTRVIKLLLTVGMEEQISGKIWVSSKMLNRLLPISIRLNNLPNFVSFPLPTLPTEITQVELSGIQFGGLQEEEQQRQISPQRNLASFIHR